MEYTKGKWEVRGNFIVADNGDNIAQWCGYTTTNKEPNANLISASPDMYEALGLALRLIITEIPIKKAIDVRHKIMEALAKAEGKSRYGYDTCRNKRDGS